nr:MAG TPA: intron associated endonuclease [Caudoviricetes sp.]
MKKEIYKITNKTNGKIYIGQSVNSLIRFAGHKSNAKKPHRNSAIDKAIDKYGIENFELKVIEITEDYNAREKFWIKFYNSLVPYGYNIMDGGENFEIGAKSPNASLNEEQINKIVKDLISSSKPMKKIAEENFTTLKIVSAVNRGTSYKNMDLSYPLRKRDNDLINEQLAQEIKEELLNGTLSLRAIARKFSVNSSMIQSLNQGKVFFDEKAIYPLRNTHKENPKYLEKVIDLLKCSSLSLRKIAEIIGISYSSVQGINSGKYFHNNAISYPIRKK